MGDIFRLLGWIILIKGWDEIIVHILSQWAVSDKRLEEKKGIFQPYLPIYIPSKCCLFIVATFHMMW